MDLDTEFYLNAAKIISGGAAVAGAIAQAFKPSAHGVRRTVIPAKYASGASYLVPALQGAKDAFNGAALYLTAATRSLIRNQKWGANNRFFVSGAAFITALAASTYLTDVVDPSGFNPENITLGYVLANSSMLIGSMGDFFKEGRRLRALTFAALGSCALPLAAVSDNDMVLAAEFIRVSSYGAAMYYHDFKNAAGPKDENKKQNLLQRGWSNAVSHIHYGLIKNRVTGASIEGQISSDDLNKRLHAEEKANEGNTNWNKKTAKEKIAADLYIKKAENDNQAGKNNPMFDPSERIKYLQNIELAAA